MYTGGKHKVKISNAAGLDFIFVWDLDERYMQIR